MDRCGGTSSSGLLHHRGGSAEKVAKVYSYREKLMLIPNMKHFSFRISFFNGTQDNYGLKRPALTPD